MAKFKLIAKENFQFGSGVKRMDDIITVSDSFLKKEMEKGKHPLTKNYISAVLNHCDPLDDETAKFLGVEKKQAPAGPDEEAERIGEIRKEMDEMGAAYDKRWKLERLENELIKARKNRAE